MSGLFKSVKKVFKKVVKVIKKVAPIALAVGAIVFTGGAALGLPSMAGGWGAAVTKGLSAIGISGGGAISSVLTGAVTQAGYGAAIGGVASAAMGGKFSDGARAGALTGAITGGVMGGMGMATDPLAKVWESKAAGAATTGNGGLMSAANGGAPATAAGPGGAPIAAPAGAGPGMPTATNAVANTAGAATEAASKGGLFSRIMDSKVTGAVVSGAAQGLMTGMNAKASAEADAENRRDIAKSYNLDSSEYGVNSNADGTYRPDPADKYARSEQPQGPKTGMRYRYDPESHMIILA